MKTIRANTAIYAFSDTLESVAAVQAGERVAFETMDALGGQVEGEEDALSELDFSRVNPATGPIYIEGAAPGDTLVVKIVEIRTAERGVVITGPGMGLLGDVARESVAKILPISGDGIRFDELLLPLAPMIGVIGVAPAEGSFPTGTAYRHGGNMDTKEIVAGSTVLLPVGQAGGLLALGDVHAVMGDGEICVSGCEVAARISVEIELIKGQSPPWPMVSLGDSIHILVSLPTIEEALREAALQGVLLLQRSCDISFEEAYMLASLRMDLGVSQLVDPNKTAKATLPKSLLKKDLKAIL